MYTYTVQEENIYSRKGRDMRTIKEPPRLSNSSTDTRGVFLVKNRNWTNPDYAFDWLGYGKEADRNISLLLGLDTDLAVWSQKLGSIIILLSCVQTEAKGYGRLL